MVRLWIGSSARVPEQGDLWRRTQLSNPRDVTRIEGVVVHVHDSLVAPAHHQRRVDVVGIGAVVLLVGDEIEVRLRNLQMPHRGRREAVRMHLPLQVRMSEGRHHDLDGPVPGQVRAQKVRVVVVGMDVRDVD